MKTNRQRIIEKLRERSGVSEADVPDKELLEAHKGTLRMDFVKLEIAQEDFYRVATASLEEFKQDLQKLALGMARAAKFSTKKNKNKEGK